MKYKRQESPAEADNTAYSEEFVDAQNNAQPEEDGWQKRYSDLRRHTQQQLNQSQQQMAAIQSQLDAATRSQIKFPKTDEEIDAWSAKYPEVSKIVDTIARKRAGEALQEGEKRFAHLNEIETKLNRKEAEQQLIKAHPDFAEIRASKEFHDWVAEQPLNIQDSLYKNNTDARSAARSIDLFKSDMKKTKKTGRGAASVVPRGSNVAAPSNGRMAFSESQVERMSIDEYEANEAAIDEARRNGAFSYDVSGAAR
jgi:type II secretory pathway pseudopilin PulG